MSLLKLVGVLLDYPRDEMWEHRDELLAAADHPALPKHRRADLARFVRGLLDGDPLQAQDDWLSLFDRGRSMSLLLFEHIHGESRDRGQAMVDLIDAYRRNGFELDARELPDYLPLVLEYLQQRPQEEARDWLQHVAHIVALLAARAEERRSPYALLFTILLEYADGKVNLEVMRERAAQEPRDDTPEVMDRLWEEEAVRFGAEAPDENCSPPTRSPARPAAARQVQP
ncbi:nitrate reductase molybdenum cofactor assembly chaperone [Flavobacterium sp. MXW15]|uniref:Nitrate reductase molybdenum cofactor assembly chaperone n=1 Tax=Xanthomonas chitinilytica TaxID=2989819 RepID=A0ABT3JVM2_9XANT|nr:nitrate reductase molybdenum cofactor assembly chaperone [Xanthomonas sp. H13-6]MCW4454840.1 nitrate reductase molybdenum cofactor assembly chaperone [Flavobacterium sp. MXW15]MCW4472532.1 nitrate reductase molybdenum cofactor assembly chaperone [Xanthomonas sp. H13-6]